MIKTQLTLKRSKSNNRELLHTHLQNFVFHATPHGKEILKSGEITPHKKELGYSLNREVEAISVFDFRGLNEREIDIICFENLSPYIPNSVIGEHTTHYFILSEAACSKIEPARFHTHRASCIGLKCILANDVEKFCFSAINMALIVQVLEVTWIDDRDPTYRKGIDDI